MKVLRVTATPVPGDTWVTVTVVPDDVEAPARSLNGFLGAQLPEDSHDDLWAICRVSECMVSMVEAALA